MTLPEKFLSDLQERLEAWESKGMAPTKELKTLCGKISWLSGVLPRTKWMLRVFYAVLANREAEIRGGAEEMRRARRDDSRPKEHLFPVKRLEGARVALLEYLKVTKERPTRKISLSPRDRARVSINTDASPEGLGAVLIINGQVIDVVASKVTAQDATDLNFELGASSSQGIVEGLALLVALKHWGTKLAGMTVDLTVQSDSVTALATMIQKRSAASPALNFLGAIMGIWMELFRVEDVQLQHIPGIANKVADWLSRPSKWKSSEKPAELGDVAISNCAERGEGFYPLPPPGRKPELWGASTGEADKGPCGHRMAGPDRPPVPLRGLGLGLAELLQTPRGLPIRPILSGRGGTSVGLASIETGGPLASLIRRPAAAPKAGVGGPSEIGQQPGGSPCGAPGNEGVIEGSQKQPSEPVRKRPRPVGELLNYGKEPQASFGHLGRESFVYGTMEVAADDPDQPRRPINLAQLG
eukprot:s22_g56.t1